MLNQFIIVSTKKIRSVESGFTLVELMVTIAVLAIIVSIAVPSMSRTIANQRVSSTASIIESSLKEAISESAIRRQALTYSLTGSSISITDSAGNTIQSYAINTVTPVTVSPAAVASFSIGPGKKVRNTAGTESVSATFSICDSNASGEAKKEVSINALAQVRLATNGSCT